MPQRKMNVHLFVHLGLINRVIRATSLEIGVRILNLSPAITVIRIRAS